MLKVFWEWTSVLNRRLANLNVNIGIAVSHFLMLGYTIINCKIHNLNIIIAVLFMLFDLFGIFIPGLALCRLLKIENMNDGQKVAYAYGLGIATVMVEYFLTVPIGISAFSPFLAILISVGSIWILLSGKKAGERIFNNESQLNLLGVCCWLIVVFIITYFTVSLVYTLPNETPLGNAYHPDFLRSVGANISASYGFPLQDFWQIGTIFNYHYFYSLFNAQVSLITGIDIVIESFFFYSIVSTMFLIFSCYALFSAVTKKGILVHVGILLFIFTGSLLWSNYFCLFGFEGGECFGMLAIVALLMLSKKYSIGQMAASCIFLALCTGFKGPIGIVVLIGFAVQAAIWFFSRKGKIKGLISGLSWLGAFIAVYLTFIHGHMTSTDDIHFMGMWKGVENNQWIHAYYEILPEWLSVPYTIKKIITLFLYYFSFGRAAMLLLLLSIIVMIVLVCKNKMGEVIFYVILNGLSITGAYIGMAFIHPGGGSQTYFSTLVVPFCIASGLMALEIILKSKRKVSIFVVSLLFLAFSREMIKWNGIYWKRANTGIAIQNEASIYWHRTGHKCLPAQYEAYRWVYNHSDTDDVIAMDYFGNSEDFNWQIDVAGIFTERYVWNAGWYSQIEDAEEIKRRNEIIDSITVLDDYAANTLHAANISFFLQNKDYSDGNLDQSENVEVAFDNDSFRIYRIY